MPIEFQEVLKANVVMAGVALLGEEDQRAQFISLVETEAVSEVLIGGPIPGGAVVVSPPTLSETGLVITLPRDRIKLMSVQSRTAIERDYPSTDDLERLAEVTWHAIESMGSSGTQPTAFGFNIELIYHPEEIKTSAKYVAELLFSNKSFNIEGWNLVGGGGKLTFEGNGALWNFTLEPRANDQSGRRVFLSLNLHRNEQRFPNREEIVRSLNEIWEHSRTFATLLDTSIQS